MNRNLRQYKKSDFQPGRLCTMQQQLILRALQKTDWCVKQSIDLNYSPGTITLSHYYQVIESLRICLKLRKII